MLAKAERSKQIFAQSDKDFNCIIRHVDKTFIKIADILRVKNKFPKQMNYTKVILHKKKTLDVK